MDGVAESNGRLIIDFFPSVRTLTPQSILALSAAEAES